MTAKFQNELGAEATVGNLNVRGAITPPQAGTVTAGTTMTGTGAAASPLNVVGGALQTGQLATNANGLKLTTVSGVLATAEIRAFVGDPNGLVSAEVGSLVLDLLTPALWQNDDGAESWIRLGAGGAQVLFDTVLPLHTFNTGDGTIYNNVDFGVLGQNTFVAFDWVDAGGSSVITGISNGGVAMSAADDGKTLCVLNRSAGNSARWGNLELSTPSNQLLCLQRTDMRQLPGSPVWWRYTSVASRWEIIGAPGVNG